MYVVVVVVAQDVVANNDDFQLVTVSHDSVVKVWDQRTTRCVQTLVDKSRSGLRPDAQMLTILYDRDFGTAMCGCYEKLQ